MLTEILVMVRKVKLCVPHEVNGELKKIIEQCLDIKKIVYLQPIKKEITMKKKIKTKEEARAFFQKIIDDKNAMIDCIENGGDMKALIKNRGIEIVKPLSLQ